MKLKDLKRKCKYSEESVYIFSQLNKKQRAREAMRFHEMKIIVQFGLIVFVFQMLLITLFSLVW